MSRKARSTALLVLICVLIVLAGWTMLPASASKANDLGYYSWCSFAPWSALSLLLVAGVLWAIRNYLLTRGD